jgi:hypothetical protein
VYIEKSQPTTCFGLFQLGHLQVGYNGQRNYTIMQYNNTGQQRFRPMSNIVVFLTAISIRIGLLSSKIHNGDDTPKDENIRETIKISENKT